MSGAVGSKPALILRGLSSAQDFSSFFEEVRLYNDLDSAPLYDLKLLFGFQHKQYNKMFIDLRSIEYSRDPHSKSITEGIGEEKTFTIASSVRRLVSRKTDCVLLTFS